MWSSKVGSLILLLALSGCGYTLNHRLKDSFYDKRGIFVPIFLNRSDEIGAERAFTNALIHELQSRREIVITSREAADLTQFALSYILNHYRRGNIDGVRVNGKCVLLCKRSVLRWAATRPGSSRHAKGA